LAVIKVAGLAFIDVIVHKNKRLRI
jgi:hypothetical protein